MTDSDGYFPEHLSHDEYLRRRIRDVDAGMRNLADIVLPRLAALEAPDPKYPVRGHASVPGRVTMRLTTTTKDAE